MAATNASSTSERQRKNKKENPHESRVDEAPVSRPVATVITHTLVREYMGTPREERSHQGCTACAASTQLEATLPHWD